MSACGPCVRQVDADAFGAATSESRDNERDAHGSFRGECSDHVEHDERSRGQRGCGERGARR